MYVSPSYNQTSVVTASAAEPVANASAPIVMAVEPLVSPDYHRLLLVRGQAFGSVPGQVMLDVGGAQRALEVVEWNDSAAYAKLPAMQAKAGTRITVQLLRADGAPSEPFDPAR